MQQMQLAILRAVYQVYGDTEVKRAVDQHFAQYRRSKKRMTLVAWQHSAMTPGAIPINV